ncbi:hypothetical protein C8J56DRAFT_1160531 [Mycena floridula]|nr:hypothetical protein C8J56DRAFT_1160531 [Mycena floridula]
MKPHHYPLVAHRKLSTATFILLLTAFALQLLVGLSLTIIKAIYLLRVYSTTTDQPKTSIATELRFGVWGVCASSALDPPGFFSNNGDCIGPMLGYPVPDTIPSLIGLSTSVVSVILSGVLVFLVLHLVAAGFSFVSFMTSLFLASHGLAILCLVLSIISALLTTVMFALDMALVITAKDQIPPLTDGFGVGFGNGVWMILVAMICTWTAVVLLSARLCYCCGVRRHHHYDRRKSRERETKA